MIKRLAGPKGKEKITSAQRRVSKMAADLMKVAT